MTQAVETVQNSAQTLSLLRLAICPTFTLEPQKKALQSALELSAADRAEVHIADMDTIEAEIFNPESQTYEFNPDAVLILWRFEDIAPDLLFGAHAMDTDKREAYYHQLIDRLDGIVQSYKGPAPLFLSTMPLPGCMNMPLNIAFGPAEILYRVNAHIHALAAAHHNISVFDFAAWAGLEGSVFSSEKYDLYAKQAIAPGAIDSFGEFMAKTLKPLKCPPKKVLALDLDNTLWGGVLGEDLISGLKIGQEYPGNVYFRIQQVVKAHKDQGVLLVLISKNNESDVREAFEALAGQMPLGLDDFTLIKANWEPKSKNIIGVVRELNLGIDSVVFLDDSTFEREQVRQTCPEVTVLDHKGDPLSMLESLRDFDGFHQMSIQAEDALRAQDYAYASKRSLLEEKTGSYEAFIRSLELRATLAAVDEKSIGRAVQMLGKTNQFNVTTRRHDLAAVTKFCDNPRNTLITLSLADKFGDQGIIGLAIALESDEKSAYIDSFLLSCRALGRGAETVLWTALVKQLKAKGYTDIKAHYIPTAKNEQVRDLFKKFGMDEIEVAKDGTKTYHIRTDNLDTAYSELINIEDYINRDG